MEQDMITVVAPAYNHEAYILDALQSVSDQSYENKELIVIDDHSTDRTPELIANFLKREDVILAFPGGIKFVRHQENRNAHYSLNEAIGLAKGNHIAVINTDDIYAANRLAEMMDALKKQGGRVAFSGVKIINEHSEIKDYEPFRSMQKRMDQCPRISLYLAVENASVSTGNYVFEKKLYQEVDGFDARYHFIHDWDFMLKCCLRTEPLYVTDTQYLYRFHETNTMKQIDESREMREKKEKEVYGVLSNYLEQIRKGNYSNDQMPGQDVWDYYLNHKKICYASSIWNELG